MRRDALRQSIAGGETSAGVNGLDWNNPRSYTMALAAAPDMTDTRQHAHQLIDRLPETQIAGLVQFLETIVDPVSAALRDAPLDDEQETEEEQAAVSEARDWLRNNGGNGIPHTEAMRSLGLK